MNMLILSIHGFDDLKDSFRRLIWETHLSNEKNPGCLGYIGDYTTQLYVDKNKPV